MMQNPDFCGLHKCPAKNEDFRPSAHSLKCPIASGITENHLRDYFAKQRSIFGKIDPSIK